MYTYFIFRQFMVVTLEGLSSRLNIFVNFLQASVVDGASRRSGSKLRGFTFFINHNNEELPLSDLDLTFVPENDLCYSQVDLYPAILVMSTHAVVTNLAITGEKIDQSDKLKRLFIFTQQVT